MASEAVEYLEERYRPLLAVLRRSEQVSFARVAPTCYVLWMPGRKVTLSWQGEPLPDALEDVDHWLVEGPSGRFVIPTRHPVLMLACDILDAAQGKVLSPA